MRISDVFKFFLNPAFAITKAFTLSVGGGGGGGTSTAYTQTSNVPSYLKEEYKNLIGQAQQQIYNIDENGNITGFKSYVPYSANPADYVAGFSPLQEQAFKGVANLSVPGQFGQATDLAQAAGMGGINSAQQAYNYGAQGAQYGGLGAQYGAQGAGYGDIAAQIGQMGLQAQGLGEDISAQSQAYAAQQAAAGRNYAQQATDAAAVQEYMSPYMQTVINLQKDAATRDYNIQKAQRQATAAKSGAYGGSRQAIQEAEAEKALNTQLQNIEATGLQSAYDKALQSMQYGTTLGTQGLAGAQSGLGTALQGGQLGLSGIGTALQGLQGGMQGAGVGIQGAQAGMQGSQVGLQGVSGAQAGYGLANQAAGQLTTTGQAQNQAALDILRAQSLAGQQQQQQQQNIINQAVQNYASAQAYPQEQLSYLSGLIHGTPGAGTVTQQYQPAPSILGQLAGAGTALYGMSQLGKAEGGIVKLAQGGMVKGYAGGGDVTGIDNVERIAQGLSAPQLQQAIKNKSVPEYIGIPLLAQKQQEQQRVQMAQAAQQQPPQQTIKDQILSQGAGVDQIKSNFQPTFSAAEGGIVAFGEGGDVVRAYEGLYTPEVLKTKPKSYWEKVKEAYKNAGIENSFLEDSLRRNAESMGFGALIPQGGGGYTPTNTDKAPNSQEQQLLQAAALNTQPKLTGERIEEDKFPGVPQGGYNSAGLYKRFEDALAPVKTEIEKIQNYRSPYETDMNTAAQGIKTRAEQTPMTRAQAEEEAGKMYTGKAYEDYEKYTHGELDKLGLKEKDATAKGYILAGLNMIKSATPKAGQATPTFLDVFSSGAISGIEYTAAQEKELEKARQFHNKSLADISQARRLEDQGKYKEAQRLYERSSDKHEDAQDKLFSVYSSLDKRDQDKFLKGVELNAQVGVAQAKELSDIGQAEMSQTGADRRLGAQLGAEKWLYTHGLKGTSGSEKGGFTSQQISQLRSNFLPQAKANIEQSPAFQRMGAAQRKQNQRLIDQAIEEEVNRLVQNEMGAVSQARHGTSSVIDYSALQGIK